MAKLFATQNLPADVTQVIDQLERHCLAPDGSLISKSTYYDLQLVFFQLLHFHIFLFYFSLGILVNNLHYLTMQAREEMCKERQRYLEAMVLL